MKEETLVRRLRYASLPDQDGRYANHLCGEAAERIEALEEEVKTLQGRLGRRSTEQPET